MSQYTTDKILDMIEANGGPRGLDLSGKDLSGIDFSANAIREKAELYRAKNRKEAPWYSGDTQGTNLQGADLIGADLQGAYLGQANLQGARLSEADLQGASLSWANLRGAYLSWASLQGAYLFWSDLQGARLFRANLAGAHISEANLHGVDLRSIRALEGAYLARARLDGALIDRDKLGGATGEERDRDWETARMAYRELKVNWRHHGLNDDARWAGIKEWDMKRKHQQQRLLHREWAVFPSFMESWAWWLSSNYGESPRRVLLWILFFAFALFPFLYWALHGVAPIDGVSSIQARDYLWFSLRSMVTLAYFDLKPANTVGNLLAFLQGALGVGLFALLVFVMGRRASGY